jgi:AcrR family transcriptional regulator
MAGRVTHTASRGPAAPASRDERKARTRRALLDAALVLLSGERSFSSLSLREVTKQAGVSPAAFYRHFDNMEVLGLALVEESFATLRRTMRDIRAMPVPTTDLIHRSVDTFLGHAREHELHFRFIAKERYGGSTTLRTAIRLEVRLFTSELAVDLARSSRWSGLGAEDLTRLAGLIVQTVIFATELMLDTEPDDVTELGQIIDDATRQLQMVLLGIR